MMSTSSLPIINAYWVSPGQLMAGEYPGAKDPMEAHRKIYGLLQLGIRTFINLMEPGEIDRYGRIFSPYEPIVERITGDLGIPATCVQFPIRDMDVPDIKTMSAILGNIDWAQAANRPAYVHCLAGLGRTGTVVGCWLIRHGIATREDAIDHIERLRRYAGNAHLSSPQSDVQRHMITHWPE